MKSMFVLLVACLAAAACAEESYRLQFTDRGPYSDKFVEQRANKKQVFINDCGKRVTEPYGFLAQEYKRGSASAGDKCSWHLQAPANHRVNVVSVAFILDDETKPPRSDDIKVSTISIYDGAEPEQANLLTTYHVTPQEKVGHLGRSLSSKQDMLVEVAYHDNKDFATQRVLINYEFLDADEVNDLLRAY